MKFRMAENKDYDVISRLAYEIFEVHLYRRLDIYHDGTPWSKNLYESFIDNTNEWILLCEDDNGQAMGMCHYKLLDMPEGPITNKRKVIFIEDLCVEKNYRGKGIGKLIVDKVEKHSRELKVDALELNVWSVNTEGEKFYEKLGLKPKSVRMEKVL